MFRINLFLKINTFFRGIFLGNNKIYLKTIIKEISTQSKKKKLLSQTLVELVFYIS